MMKKFLLALAIGITAAAQSAETLQPARWTAEKANAWYTKEPWLVGSNYLPSYAINELEMWQADTFDPKRIDKELEWAQNIGMNTMRVFLQDQLWQHDPSGFRKRIDEFLTIAASHKITPILVLFDSCWDPNPKLGSQHKPTPGVHNSGWVQSPGQQELTNEADYPKLAEYVNGVVSAFATDDRVLAWDIWNEPDNLNTSSYGKKEPPNKVQLVLALLPRAFAWAREAKPTQPLTSGIWHEDPAKPNELSAMAKEQLELSDVVSFHNYSPPAKFEAEVKWLESYHRPLICTEYMARPEGSSFQTILPIAKKFKVAAINWGFVAGKSQTYLPWDSWKQPYVNGRSPAVWFHDIFREDGKPYRSAETNFIRKITQASAGSDSSAALK
jgi:hypothetical protein